MVTSLPDIVTVVAQVSSDPPKLPYMDWVIPDISAVHTPEIADPVPPRWMATITATGVALQAKVCDPLLPIEAVNVSTLVMSMPIIVDPSIRVGVAALPTVVGPLVAPMARPPSPPSLTILD